MDKFQEKEIIKKVVKAWDDAVKPYVDRYTVPIWAVHGNKRFQLGTGITFAVADEHFLVTARHVSDRVKNRGCQLYISDNSPEGSKAFLLDGEVHMALNDGYDVSLIVLSPKQASQLAHFSFLRLSDIDFGQEPLEMGIYYVSGYPGEWNEVPKEGGELTPEGIFYSTHLEPPSTDYDSLQDYRRDVHILLVYSEGAPDWHGISGCGIWRAWQPEKKKYPPELEQVKLVAVETCFYEKSKLIRGTRWAVVLELLIKTCPYLRRPIEVHTGPLKIDSAS